MGSDELVGEEKVNIKDHVKKRYSAIAVSGSGCCLGGCGCSGDKVKLSREIGYSPEDLGTIPDSANLGLGCGNPTAFSDIRLGDIVLDLGSGAGIDAFLAAKKVGETGKVIGVDMTPAMIQRATDNARRNGYKNVEFRQGDIEDLPVDSRSVDVIISNCVINLAGDKLKAFKEAHRVLKPGGRMYISDIVTRGDLPEEVRADLDAWAGCIAGALPEDEYIAIIKKAGFRKIEILSEKSYGDAEGISSEAKVISLNLKAMN